MEADEFRGLIILGTEFALALFGQDLEIGFGLCRSAGHQQRHRSRRPILDEFF